MTDDELEAIERRLVEASPAPWVPGRSEGRNAWFEAPYGTAIESRGTAFALGMAVGLTATKADAEFVACARIDVPDLVAEVRRLRALPVIETCGGCGCYERPLCVHSDIEFAREAHGILGTVGDGKSAPPDWCPLRRKP